MPYDPGANCEHRCNTAARRRPSRSRFVLATLVITAACSSASNHAILSFFFDGVPDPANPAAAAPVEAAPVPATAAMGPEPPRQPPLHVHRPYAEGRCEKCHSSREGKPATIGSVFQGVPMLLEPIQKLCFKCHGIVQQKYLHAPAVSGQCTFCHDPHQTQNRRMLLASSTREVCGRCHFGSTFLTEKNHAPYSDRECIDCHDPHSAAIEFNLLPGAKEGTPEARKPTVTLPTKW